MSIDYIDADDELLGILNDVIELKSAAIIGYVPEIRWPGDSLATKPAREKFWARASTQIVTDGQASLANVQGVKAYQAVGLCYLQIFCPRNQAASLDKGRAFAEVVRDRFRSASPSGEIWFRNQRIIKQPDGDFYTFNVVVQYEYKTYSNPDAFGFGDDFGTFGG